MVVLIIVAAILLMMGIIVLIGKGDKLIAGYNTASEKERAKYHVKRLRALIGGLLIVLAPMMVFLLGKETMESAGTFGALTMIACIIVLILANTWAKKK